MGIIRKLYVVVMLVALAGCGVQGNLYLPEEKSFGGSYERLDNGSL